MLYQSESLKSRASEIMRDVRDSFYYIGNEMIDSTQRGLRSVVERAHTEAMLGNVQRQLEKGELILPDDAIQNSVRSALDRDFLNMHNNWAQFEQPDELFFQQGWLRLIRLPISPLEEKAYALYPRWQNAIATIHALNHRLCYVLMRRKGETRLYIGAIPGKQEEGRGAECQMQLGQAIESQMPGIGTEYLDRQGAQAAFSPLKILTCCGTVTGIPSIRKITEYGEYQTMDQIAMGLRKNGVEQDFAVVIHAQPVPDSEIVKILRTMENLGSEIHSLTKYTRSGSVNRSDTISVTDTRGNSASLDIKAGISKILSANLGANIAASISSSQASGAAVGRSETVSVEYINKSAIYCEEVLDKHIARLKAGRNLGFWKTGVYVLAQSQSVVQTVMGMLRAVYSGDDTYIEPIRTISLPQNSGADVLIRMFQHVPYPRQSVASVLGEIYQDYATPMTTEELSIATSLPRLDLPGFRLVRSAARFATRPPQAEGEKTIQLGEILDTGVPTHQMYRQQTSLLSQHVLVTGTSGAGKTYTCQTILEQTEAMGIPFLVIEPTKDEYLEWAVRQNKEAGKEKILVFAPGRHDSTGNLRELRLNLFQPAGIPGAQLDMQGHLDRLKSAFIGSMTESDIPAFMMEEILYTYVASQMDVKDYASFGNGNPLESLFTDDGTLKYPFLEGMERMAGTVVQNRIRPLLLGWKKSLFHTQRSTSFQDLFQRYSVVINLSHLTDDRDKVFVMSVLLIALWEYRESEYRYDDVYKQAANQKRLMHLTLIEEAHRLMPDIAPDGLQSSRTIANTAKMSGNLLAEIRDYGEGCIIVDQIPVRLMPDVIKNTGLKIIHRLNSLDDMKTISGSMMLRRDQEAVIGTLQRGQAVIRSEFDDAAAWIRVCKPENK